MLTLQCHSVRTALCRKVCPPNCHTLFQAAQSVQLGAPQRRVKYEQVKLHRSLEQTAQGQLGQSEDLRVSQALPAPVATWAAQANQVLR